MQLIESYVVEPLVEGSASSLPPVDRHFPGDQCAVAGPHRVLIATPLLVVLVVSLRILYVRGVLAEDVEVIGN